MINCPKDYGLPTFRNDGPSIPFENPDCNAINLNGNVTANIDLTPVVNAITTQTTTIVDALNNLTLDDPYKFKKLEMVCKCNDVAGDGSNIERFVEAVLTVVNLDDTVTTTSLGNFTDETMSTLYTTAPINEIDCCDAEQGETVVGSSPFAQELAGPIAGYQIPTTMWVEGFTIIAKQGDVTITDSRNNVTVIPQGASLSWDAETDDIMFDNLTIDVPAAGSAIVTWTEPKTQP